MDQVQESANLIWMDLEMTGLNPEKEGILEMAVIVTDSDLNILAEGPVLYISQPESLLQAMDDWNTTHHTQSGLIERVKSEGISDQEAEERMLEFLKNHTRAGESPLCGNTIGQDRRFLVRYQPRLDAWLNYRSIDVSSIKELAKRWRPELMSCFSKKEAHRALDDIRESIEELRFYREHFFRAG